MAGEGAILRMAREEKGWSYEEVEDAIKIRVRYLSALENEEYNVLPGATYTRGFLRTYAKHLGLDPQEIIDKFNMSFAKEAQPAMTTPLAPIPQKQVWFRPLVIAVMAILAIIIVVVVIMLTRGDNPEIGYKPPTLPTAPPTAQEDNNTDETENDNSSNPAQNSGQPAGQPGEQPEVYDGIVAELTFNSDCWLVVEVDGKKEINGMVASGTTKTLEADQKIEFVRVGNAGGLTLTVNGKTLPPLGKTGAVVDNYVIDLNNLNTLTGTPETPQNTEQTETDPDLEQ